MKKIIIYLFACLITLQIQAQKTVVKVEGVANGIVFLKSLTGPEIKQIKVANGSAEFTLERLQPRQICMLGANNRVVFFAPIPLKTVTIYMDGPKIDVRGAGGVVNTYLANWTHQLFTALPNTLVNRYLSETATKVYVELNPADLSNEDYVNQWQALEKKMLADLDKSGIDDSEFVENQKALIQHMSWSALGGALLFLDFKKSTIPASLIKQLVQFDFNSPLYESFSGKDEFLKAYMKAAELSGGVEPTLENYIAQKARMIPQNSIREAYILGELTTITRQRDFLFMKELFDSSKPLLTSEKAKEKYDELKKQADQLMASNHYDGVKAMSFAFENQKGEIVKLEDFKGKYLYIDIWATWCGPCKQEIPNLQKLEKEMEGENIAFLSISVDKQKQIDKWKAFLQEKEMKGCTLIATNDFQTPFIQHYRINAIPRFMLIGPDGTMIAHKCWRPRDTRLKRYLMTLLHPENK